ncbi:MAG: hypothetical protein RLZZ341_1936, partial [Pseudomonadota bacterium]
MAPPIGEIRFADFLRRLRTARAGRVLADQAATHLAEGMPPLAIFAFDHVGRSVELWGRYERDELALLMQCLEDLVDRGGVAVDVGANVGNHALFFAAHFAEVLAFEPHPRTHALLALNASLRSNVRCFPFALSDRVGTAMLATPPGNAGMASIEKADGAAESRGAVEVPLRRLDDLAELAACDNPSDPELIQRLPYLGAVVNEVLRIHPVAMLMFPRLVEEPLAMGGWNFEPGDVVIGCIQAVHERPELYPDPQRFDPQRFLRRSFGPGEFLPFGGGARRCIGAALAVYEMKLILAALL